MDAAPMTATPASVQAFFDGYAAAFEAFDAAAVARHDALPCGILDARGYTHRHDAAGLESNMQALCALYRSRGLVGARPRLRQWLPQGAFAGYADVGWTLRWRAADGSVGETGFGTGYLLRRVADDWRIQLCTAYEET